MYENQDKVNHIADELRNMDETLEIYGYVLKENRVMVVKISIMEKGNSKLINKLKSLGWVKTWREKVRTDSGSYTNQYSGYAMRVTMELNV